MKERKKERMKERKKEGKKEDRVRMKSIERDRDKKRL